MFAFLKKPLTDSKVKVGVGTPNVDLARVFRPEVKKDLGILKGVVQWRKAGSVYEGQIGTGPDQEHGHVDLAVEDGTSQGRIAGFGILTVEDRVLVPKNDNVIEILKDKSGTVHF